MSKTTITEDYRKQQQALHQNPNYGVASLGFAPAIAQIIRQLDVRSVSDYGAGKMNLRKGLNESGIKDFAYFPYDPAFPEYGEPHPADLVCCIDVLEHIEPHLLDNVLDELARISVKFGFFTIHMQAAAKVLPDGRNAHLIQKPASWWLPKLSKRFEIRHLETLQQAYGFWVLVEPKTKVVEEEPLVSEELFEEAKSLFLAGVALMEQGQYKTAEVKYRASLGLLPGRPASLTNLSSTLLAQEKYDEALDCATQALESEPDNTEACLNVAVVHEKLKRKSMARDWYEKVLALNPDHSAALSNLGSLIDDMGKPAEALPYYERALKADPGNAQAWTNRGATYMHLKKYEEAIQAYEKSIALAPQLPESYYNKGMLHLTLCQFGQGWKLYEHRWQSNSSKSVPLKSSKPRWAGQKMSGALFVWAEQGVGDHVFYCSMLKSLIAMHSKLIVSVDGRMLPIMRRSFPGIEFVDQKSPPQEVRYDYQIAMGSLGEWLRPDVASFSQQPNSYLVADQARAKTLRQKINAGGKKVCGISWISKNDSIGEFKSLELADLLPILRNPEYVFVDLQYGDTSKERAKLEEEHGIKVVKLQEVDNFSDLDGLTALIEACDVVCTVSNTTTHFAGAIGKETLLLAPYALGKIWYWHDEQDVSIWYPNVRIFRQQAMGDWAGPIKAIRQELMK
jgi:tetratricopeptide (TPR) repeat protein